MKIECIHGYFKFEETRSGQISQFVGRFGLMIARSGDHFTFEDLVDAPSYSIPGGAFMGCLTTETFQGAPWDVMRANNLVYDFNRGSVLPILSITQSLKLSSAGQFFVSQGMIIPGSITEDGKRVRDYSAFFEQLSFRYSEVGLE